MDVSFGDVRDPQVLRLCRTDILLDVAIGVDHHRLTSGSAAYQVARLG